MEVLRSGKAKPALMKGHTFKDRKHKLTYPVGVDLKYDEVRCHVKVHSMTDVEFWSYAGKPLANMQEFSALFAQVWKLTGWKEFDCGLEINENFNDTYRWVRSTKGLPADLKSKASWRFWLFDLPESTATYDFRRQEMAVVEDVASVWYLPGCLKMPEHYTCQNEDEVHTLFGKVVARGIEGLMVKTLDHKYERGKRIDGWLKYKPSEDADGVIEGFIEATATVADPDRGIAVGDGLCRIGSVVVRTDDGTIGKPHGIAHELGRDMYLHPEKYLGQWCEFKFMMRDRQGGYRHPTFNRVREAKA